ncbi:MAG TPA: DUF1918 domain-containing protein [Acidimicrobiales bacterium]|nr:DUF1918 domain-containing protein [Acidimicrobiales bacterium]
MPNVGDHVRVHSKKVGEASRDGVVVDVIGQLLRIRWMTGEESTMVPGPGSLAVIEKKELSSDNKGSAPSKATKGMKSGQKAQRAVKKPPR